MATDFQSGGLKAVHMSDDATLDSWTAISGDVVEAEGLEETLIEQQTTNSAYQSGGAIAPKARFSDHQDKATMRALAVGNARAKKYFALEYFSGKIYRTSEALYPMVADQPKPRRADGDSLWELSFKLEADAPYTAVASLTS